MLLHFDKSPFHVRDPEKDKYLYRCPAASLRNVDMHCGVSLVIVYTDGLLQSRPPSDAAIRRVSRVAAKLTTALIKTRCVFSKTQSVLSVASRYSQLVHVA